MRILLTFFIIINFLYVYDVHAQIFKIYSPTKQAYDFFGYTVSVSDGFALIHKEKVENRSEHLFKKTGKNNWALKQNIEIEEMGILKNNHAVFPLGHDTLFGIFKKNANSINGKPIESIIRFNKGGLHSFYFSDNWLIFRIFDQLYNPLSTKYYDYFYRFENNKLVFYNDFEQIAPFKNRPHYYSRICRVTNNSDIAVLSFMVQNPDNDKYFSKMDVYRFNGEHWYKSQEIFEPLVPDKDSDLGYFVSLSPDGKYLAACTEYGDVYIYKNENDQFRIHQNIIIPDESARRALKITNDELLIGNTDLSPNPLQGIRFYKLINDVWVKQRDIRPPQGDNTFKYFGKTIDRDGETVITGAHDNKYGLYSGAAYIFQIPARDTFTTSVCKGEGYAFGDTTYYESGTYRDTLIASYGVDSVVVLNLTVLPVYKHKLDTVLCEGQIVQIGDQVFDQSGHFTIKLTSSIGCDSTIDLTLRVIDREYPAVDTFFCTGSTISLQGQNITSGGTYSFILKNINGCDSLISYEVHQIDPDIQKIDTSFCEEHTLMINGKQISESGIYSFDLKNRFGCDSIVSYFVTEIPVKFTKIDTLICEGESISIAGNVLNQPGRYEFKVVASSGCDSLIMLELKTALKNNKSVDTVLCAGQSIKIGDQLIDEAGEYSIVLKNINECDSTVNIRISKSELEVTDEVFSDLGCKSGRIELDVNGNRPPFHYLWNTGSTQEDLVVAEKGNYVLTIIDNTGCSYEFSFEIFDSTAYLIPEAFTPDDQNEELNRTFWIYIADQGYAKPRVKILSTEIFNRWGEKVFSSAGSNFWDGTYRSKPVQAGVYIYAIVIDTPCGIKTEKGQLLLLR